MEPLWSAAGATGGNRWQIERTHQASKQAKSPWSEAVEDADVAEPAVGCEGVHVAANQV